MEIFESLVFLLFGIIAIIYGGNWFVDAAIKLSRRTKIPEVLMGATVVALATTLPEIIVSLISASQGHFDMSVGNAVGTVVCNTALICGIGFSATSYAIKQKGGTFKFYLLLFVLLVFIMFALDGNISASESVSLLILFIGFFTLNILEAKKEMHDPLLKTYKSDNKKESVFGMLMLFVVGAVLIAAGAYYLIEGGASVARLFGISEDFIGVVIMGVGTSIPELITTLQAIKSKAPSLGLGNIVGANIINLTLNLGMSGLVSGCGGLPIGKVSLYLSLPVAFATIYLLIVPLILHRKTFKWQGITLLAIYALYLISIIILPKFGYFA